MTPCHFMQPHCRKGSGQGFGPKTAIRGLF
jgi:hypothetical protein